MIRCLLLTALFSALLVAEPASAGRRCRVLAKQIAHFENVLDMARERDDELWAEGTKRHIARLEARRDRLCPRPEGDGVRFARSLGRFLKAAASAAASAAAAALLP